MKKIVRKFPRFSIFSDINHKKIYKKLLSENYKKINGSEKKNPKFFTILV